MTKNVHYSEVSEAEQATTPGDLERPLPLWVCAWSILATSLVLHGIIFALFALLIDG